MWTFKIENVDGDYDGPREIILTDMEYRAPTVVVWMTTTFLNGEYSMYKALGATVFKIEDLKDRKVYTRQNLDSGLLKERVDMQILRKLFGKLYHQPTYMHPLYKF